MKRALLTLTFLVPFGSAMATPGTGAIPGFKAGACPSTIGQFDIVLEATPGSASDCTEQVMITSATAGAPLTVSLVPANSTHGITYEDDEDVLVGVWNNSGAPVSSIHIQGSATEATTGAVPLPAFTANIFGFDGDGIKIFTGPLADADGTNGRDANYAGPNNTFSYDPGGDLSSGDVNFITPLAPGDYAYFSLEQPIDDGSVNGPPCVGDGCGGGQTGAPEPASIALLGAGLFGLGTLRRRRRS